MEQCLFLCPKYVPTIAEVSTTVACAAVAILALYECIKEAKLGKDVDGILDDKANVIYNSVVTGRVLV